MNPFKKQVGKSRKPAIPVELSECERCGTPVATVNPKPGAPVYCTPCKDRYDKLDKERELDAWDRGELNF